MHQTVQLLKHLNPQIANNKDRPNYSFSPPVTSSKTNNAWGKNKRFGHSMITFPRYHPGYTPYLSTKAWRLRFSYSLRMAPSATPTTSNRFHGKCIVHLIENKPQIKRRMKSCCHKRLISDSIFVRSIYYSQDSDGNLGESNNISSIWEDIWRRFWVDWDREWDDK